ncbi:MAG: hypothetical protein E7387_08400 [Ruminococcaceae bacterium]|nr:hypothetical protein [Oscillospiraceae bacterium]
MNKKFIPVRKVLAVALVFLLAFGICGCNAEDIQSQIQKAYKNQSETAESKKEVSDEKKSSENIDDSDTTDFSVSKTENGKTNLSAGGSSSNKKSNTKSNNKSKSSLVSSSATNVSSYDNQKETIEVEELEDLHNMIVPQDPEPDVKEDFKPIVDNKFSKGNGTQTNPYIISTAEELVYFSKKVNSGEMDNGVCVALGANIDMTGVKFSPIGNSSYRFSSNFDGRGFTVSNITPELIYEDYGNNANYHCGFFGFVKNAKIKNLRLENVNIKYTYESYYFTEIGILAACVYPTSECEITDCYVNGTINAQIDTLVTGGIVGDIFVTNGAKLKMERLQSNTKMQLRSDTVNAGAVSGTLLVRGEESFSDIFAQSEIIQVTRYGSYIGAFGGVSNTSGNINVSNCFFKINTNKKNNDYVHPLIGGIIDSHQPTGKYNFKNVFGVADGCDKLYQITPETLVKEENCAFTDVLPSGCNFDSKIWDISDPAAPFIKFGF